MPCALRAACGFPVIVEANAFGGAPLFRSPSSWKENCGELWKRTIRWPRSVYRHGRLSRCGASAVTVPKNLRGYGRFVKTFFCTSSMAPHGQTSEYILDMAASIYICFLFASAKLTSSTGIPWHAHMQPNGPWQRDKNSTDELSSLQRTSQYMHLGSESDSCILHRTLAFHDLSMFARTNTSSVMKLRCTQRINSTRRTSTQAEPNVSKGSQSCLRCSGASTEIHRTWSWRSFDPSRLLPSPRQICQVVLEILETYLKRRLSNVGQTLYCWAMRPICSEHVLFQMCLVVESQTLSLSGG